MNIKINAIMVEILLHLFTIDSEDIHVHNSQTTTPSLVAVSKVAVAGVEDAIKEGEVVFNLLIALYVEASFGLRNSCFKVRHD